jgi:hypothetical protein
MDNPFDPLTLLLIHKVGDEEIQLLAVFKEPSKQGEHLVIGALIQPVITVDYLEIGTTSYPQARIDSRSVPTVLLVYHPDVIWIHECVLVSDSRGVIGRTVIDNDDLNVRTSWIDQ